MRQVVHRKGLDLADGFPVLIYLEDVAYVESYIFAQEVVVYCTILHSNFDIIDVKLFHRMVSVRRLVLHIMAFKKLSDSIFASMLQLLLLDLSHNFITFLSKTHCALYKILKIFLYITT